MVQQGFWIGDRSWYVMCYYDIRSESDLLEVEKALLSSGCPYEKVEEALDVLSDWNTGCTYSNLSERFSVVFIGKATNAEEMYNTIQHETKHVTEHIGEYFGISPTSEESAYLQGGIAMKMFPAASIVVCPRCHEEERGKYAS